MLDTFIHFVLKQRLLIFIATGALIIGGVAAWRNLPIDAFPDLTNVQVMVLTEAPGSLRWMWSNGSPFRWKWPCRGFRK